MKPISLIAVFVVLFFNSFAQSKSPKGKLENSLLLTYSGPNKSIEIRKNVLFLTEVIEEYNNPVSAVPSSRKEVIRKSTIPQKSLDSLTRLISTNGYFNLKKTDYGSTAEERNYPYILHITYKGKDKKIIYRSNPASASAPKEFTQIEQALDKLIKSLTNWENIQGVKK